ncbi:LysR family transcriptional regulator [Cronobacter sakazakii]|nr:hypothetical protein CSK29544_02374 [Cronobacter sakazakii]SPW21196.1 Virulence genes transcriptional activator [Cronobacter sakazakii]
MNLLISKKLKYFIVCFEAKCINSAAEQLCVTRSPLARVIYEMEEKMGGKLFIRKYNYLEPTELAITLYEKIKPVYDLGNDSNLLIVFYVQIMPDDFVMQLHRF